MTAAVQCTTHTQPLTYSSINNSAITLLLLHYTALEAIAHLKMINRRLHQLLAKWWICFKWSSQRVKVQNWTVNNQHTMSKLKKIRDNKQWQSLTDY